jgi:hypothetical protein
MSRAPGEGIVVAGLARMTVSAATVMGSRSVSPARDREARSRGRGELLTTATGTAEATRARRSLAPGRAVAPAEIASRARASSSVLMVGPG